MITGPTFEEVARVAMVKRAEALIVNIVDHGPSVLVSSSAMAIYDEVQAAGIWPTVVSAWAVAAVRQWGFGDLLVAQRLGYLLFAATLPLSIYWIAEKGLGRRLALLAISLLLAQPSFVHSVAVANDDALVAAGWLLVFAAYVQSLPEGDDRGRLGWTFATALFVGLAVGTSLAALWGVGAVVVHSALLRRQELASSVRSGKLPLPSALLPSLVLVPLVFVALNPNTWRGGAGKVAGLLLAPVGIDGAPYLYRGTLVDSAPFPAFEALHQLVGRVPVPVLLIMILGAILWAHRVLPGRERPARAGVGLAVGIFFLSTVFGRMATPALLSSFPTRVVAAMGLCTILGAYGLQRVAERWVPERRRGLATGMATALLVVPALSDVSSAGAHFSGAVGGPAAVLARGTFPPSDGSELGRIAEALPEPSSTVAFADVPRGFPELLATSGRAAGAVLTTRTQDADYVAVRGAAGGSVGEIRRRGNVLWSVVKAAP
jgi:hypothetical protein